MIKLTLKNFFSDLVFHPFNADNKKDRIIAFVASFACGVFSLGLCHAVCAIARCCIYKSPIEANFLDRKIIQTRNSVLSSTLTIPLVTNDQTHSKFVGIQALKIKQADHLQKLKNLAKSGDWNSLATHTAHQDSGFDWWMFPIDRSSAGQGDFYHVSPEDVKQLQNDVTFMNNYRDGVKLVLLSWGWDGEENRDISNKLQYWRNYQVRLGKMAHSLTLFKEQKLLNSLKTFCHDQKIYSTLEPWVQKYVGK